MIPLIPFVVLAILLASAAKRRGNARAARGFGVAGLVIALVALGLAVRDAVRTGREHRAPAAAPDAAAAPAPARP